jgi:hypothetical protein
MFSLRIFFFEINFGSVIPHSVQPSLFKLTNQKLILEAKTKNEKEPIALKLGRGLRKNNFAYINMHIYIYLGEKDFSYLYIFFSIYILFLHICDSSFVSLLLLGVVSQSVLFLFVTLYKNKIKINRNEHTNIIL